MKLENITKTLVNVTGKTGLTLRKFSPELWLILGVASGVGATILACKATLKVEEILDEHTEKIDKINVVWEKVKEGDIPLDKYSDTDHNKDLVLAYTQTGVEFFKVYWPSVSLGVFAIFCVVTSNGIMKQRNVALMAAYKAIEEGFSAYRKRVIAEHGEETDYMYKNGLYRTEIAEPGYTDEAGVKHKATTVTKLIEDPNGLSVYARFFDESCSQWSKNAEYNLMFLRAQQNYYNDMLKARGHVFLNEIYDALGLPRTKAGAIVGWVMDDGGDDYIDFGIFDGDKTKSRDFVNGYENSILLDFNVDGVIYDLFTKKKG